MSIYPQILRKTPFISVAFTLPFPALPLLYRHHTKRHSLWQIVCNQLITYALHIYSRASIRLARRMRKDNSISKEEKAIREMESSSQSGISQTTRMETQTAKRYVMPRGDGTGPVGGGGPGTGRGRGMGSATNDTSGRVGQSSGRGRMGGFAMGSGGNCVCPSCGKTVGHGRGTACNQIKCPACGTTMTRAQ